MILISRLFYFIFLPLLLLNCTSNEKTAGAEVCEYDHPASSRNMDYFAAKDECGNQLEKPNYAK